MYRLLSTLQIVCDSGVVRVSKVDLFNKIPPVTYNFTPEYQKKMVKAALRDRVVNVAAGILSCPSACTATADMGLTFLKTTYEHFETVFPTAWQPGNVEYLSTILSGVLKPPMLYFFVSVFFFYFRNKQFSVKLFSPSPE